MAGPEFTPDQPAGLQGQEPQSRNGQARNEAHHHVDDGIAAAGQGLRLVEERLKIALKVWRLATLKKQSRDGTHVQVNRVHVGQNTPLATPRSYTACTALMAGTFSSWMVAGGE